MTPSGRSGEVLFVLMCCYVSYWCRRSELSVFDVVIRGELWWVQFQYVIFHLIYSRSDWVGSEVWWPVSLLFFILPSGRYTSLDLCHMRLEMSVGSNPDFFSSFYNYDPYTCSFF